MHQLITTKSVFSVGVCIAKDLSLRFLWVVVLPPAGKSWTLPWNWRNPESPLRNRPNSWPPPTPTPQHTPTWEPLQDHLRHILRAHISELLFRGKEADSSDNLKLVIRTSPTCSIILEVFHLGFSWLKLWAKSACTPLRLWGWPLMLRLPMGHQSLWRPFLSLLTPFSSPDQVRTTILPGGLLWLAHWSSCPPPSQHRCCSQSGLSKAQTESKGHRYQSPQPAPHGPQWLVPPDNTMATFPVSLWTLLSPLFRMTCNFLNNSTILLPPRVCTYCSFGLECLLSLTSPLSPGSCLSSNSQLQCHLHQEASPDAPLMCSCSTLGYSIIAVFIRPYLSLSPLY